MSTPVEFILSVWDKQRKCYVSAFSYRGQVGECGGLRMDREQVASGDFWEWVWMTMGFGHGSKSTKVDTLTFSGVTVIVSPEGVAIQDAQTAKPARKPRKVKEPVA